MGGGLPRWRGPATGARRNSIRHRCTMRFLPVCAALLLAALLPATAAARPRPLSVPAKQLHAAFACDAPLEGAARTPVLLVPGTGEDPDFFDWNYEPALAKLGIPFCT